MNSKGKKISPGDFALLCSVDRNSQLLESLPSGIAYAGDPIKYDQDKLKDLLKKGETPIIRFGSGNKTH